MRNFLSFYWQCAKIAARGNAAHANDWQWVIANPLWQGIGGVVGAALGGLIASYWRGAPAVSLDTPAGVFLGGVFGFVVTWLLFFAFKFVNAPVALYHREKGRADALQQKFYPADAEQIIYVEDINLAAGLTPQTSNPVLLIGKIANNKQRLRIIVEHSHYASGMGWAGWSTPWQVQLDDLKDVFAGQQIRIPVVTFSSSLNDPGNLKWGNADGPPVNAVQRGKKYRARIRFIGADGSEQKPLHFLLIRTTPDEPPYLVNVTTETEFAFIGEWNKAQ
jgi:hypothetical protein